MTIRQSAVAGMFYNDDPDRLRTSIERSFEHRLGPGHLPILDIDGMQRLKGLVCPHAGFQYSGAAAAWAFDALASDGGTKRVVILGTSHRWSGRTPALCSYDYWATPLGNVTVDGDLNEALIDAGLTIDDDAHDSEHSIEVQLPWLQYILEDRFTICPVSIASLSPEDFVSLSQTLARILGTHHGIVLASSDLSHYMPANVARQLDGLALNQIQHLSAEGLLQVVKERDISMCGVLPVALMIETASLLGAEDARILSYYTSGDITGDTSAVVGYAAVAVE